MGISILVKLDIIIALLSFFGILGVGGQKLHEIWKFKRLREDSKHIFREFKSKILTLLERKENIEVNMENDNVEQRVITPDDHVEIQKILRKVEMLLSTNDFENAEKLLVEALAFDADDEEVNSLLAFVYMKRKKYTKAESIYIHLVELNVQDPSVYGNLAKVLEAQENYDQAARAYKEAIKRDPHNAARYYQFGLLLLQIESRGEAIEAFENAVRFDTRNTKYLFALGESYLATDTNSLAAKVFERILDIEPYNEKAKVHYLNLKEKGYL